MRQRFLERLRRAERGGEDPGSVDSKSVLDSVQRHLLLLLNTQRGSAQIANDYGIPDFFSLLGMGDVEALRRLEVLLEDVIGKYEPRLRDIEVKVVNKDDYGLDLHMQLSGSLALENETLNVSFETVLDSGGRIRIE